MITDKRIQKRKIIIDFEIEGYRENLDDIIDKIIVDLKTIITQRKYPNKIEIKITIL